MEKKTAEQLLKECPETTFLNKNMSKENFSRLIEIMNEFASLVAQQALNDAADRAEVNEEVGWKFLMTCIDGVFIRKEQGENPLPEKYISKEVKEHTDLYCKERGEEKNHFYKLVGLIGNWLTLDKKIAIEMYDEFKKAGYTLTKK